MVTIVFDEVNVFTFPHSRIKKLMNCCTSKFGHTDFTSLNDFEELLIGLQCIFTEFMAHEQIENHLVMKKLRKKLKQNSPMDDTELICNCHKVDRFTPLMALFRDGYAFIRRGNADRMSYGVRLHKAMITFYNDFVPHMNEEENGIQPLLSKYFTDIELKMMRTQVIKMTLKKREDSTVNIVYRIERPLKIYVLSYERILSIDSLPNNILQFIMNYLPDRQIKQSCLRVNKQWNQCASKVLKHRSPISQLPDEIVLRIFKLYLNPYDLFHSCIRVSKQWKYIIKDKTIWKTINPINWARGQWNSSLPLEEIPVDQYKNHSLTMNESRIIPGLANYLLPDYGHSIENLILYGSLTINDNIARKIFDLCPNLKYLNIGMTKLTPKSFIHFRWINSLESLILEGCELMDDYLFINIISSLILSKDSQLITIEDKQHCSIENSSSQLNRLTRFAICEKCSISYEKNSKIFQLKILNLSGCYQITDYGLNLLIRNGLTEYLTYIDLSGCIRITADCLSSLVSSSRNLPSENIYFCDNLSSCLLSTANCCRNVENNSGRYCCRSHN
ncbi:unnamed protein product [Rotaria magnacalcarata]|uniref:F-box domain-containing protein n=1 Tax=Rotaria magnacalcarata TaxID=392030 RepID=A0A816F5U8_9BILA|nr:unnamed protein product [Rotaria magnacalcarata]CAF1658249.1 unnamed protein product [Rotaria magnacalcarata]CAF2144841.1 unnamed protein product [Rotaria magnacalcarata]CAF3830258.1 unnamed protein product [Rotaria magnacalcarata]CAF4008991.1 unnamed protein product [Rotaria magnacalcarata]